MGTFFTSKHGLGSRGPGGTPPSKPKSSTPPEPGPSSWVLSELCNEDVDDNMVSVKDRVASSELGKENEPGQSILSSSETETVSMERPLIDKTLKFPTDPALFENRAITPSLIEEILMLGPCQPGLNEI